MASFTIVAHGYEDSGPWREAGTLAGNDPSGGLF